MGDMLTPEERALLAEHRDSYAVPSADFVKCIDRLVAEVARLRARNEALELVAEAANASPCRHSSEVRGDNCSLCVALSALAEPGNGGAT